MVLIGERSLGAGQLGPGWCAVQAGVRSSGSCERSGADDVEAESESDAELWWVKRHESQRSR